MFLLLTAKYYSLGRSKSNSFEDGVASWAEFQIYNDVFTGAILIINTPIIGATEAR